MSMLLVIGGSLFVAIAFVIWNVLTAAQERATVKASLKSIDDYERGDLRERELETPLAQRVFAPVAGSVVALGRRVMPQGYMEGVRRRLVHAGRPEPAALDQFRATRLLTIVALPIAAIGLAAVDGPVRVRLALFAFVAMLLVLGPDAQLNRRVTERKTAIRNRLPDIIDLLTISVEAGLGFDQALTRTVASVPGPLSDEFARMLGELRAGAGRVEALRNVDARTEVPELRSFLLALIQAETFGVPIGRILRNQADEMRVKRRQAAQEEAQKAPVKLLFPMVLCVFPGIFVVLLGPAMLQYLHSGF